MKSDEVIELFEEWTNFNLFFKIWAANLQFWKFKNPITFMTLRNIFDIFQRVVNKIKIFVIWFQIQQFHSGILYFERKVSKVWSSGKVVKNNNRIIFASLFNPISFICVSKNKALSCC